MKTVVIVGGGHGGFQVAESLRHEGFTGNIHLITNEACLPYHKPPLSKAFLTGRQTEEGLQFRPVSFYEKNFIKVHLAESAQRMDPTGHHIWLQSGLCLAYDKLILSTGCTPRRLGIEGEDKRGVFELRSLEDAKKLRSSILPGTRVVVVGAGFIGLEFAAVAVENGMDVTVLETQDRILSRVLPEIMSSFFMKKHAHYGVKIRTGIKVNQILGENSVTGVLLDDGSVLDADMVMVGVGVVPNESLAKDAGLECKNGILVDKHLRTSHPDIYAIGDCAMHPNPFAGSCLRIESVQNAVEQARTVAAAIAGNVDKCYESVPWFWTDQYEVKLQMAGLSSGHDSFFIRAQSAEKFSVLYYKNQKLIAVDSINAPADHLAARKLLQARISPLPELVVDTKVKLSALYDNARLNKLSGISYISQ